MDPVILRFLFEKEENFVAVNHEKMERIGRTRVKQTGYMSVTVDANGVWVSEQWVPLRCTKELWETEAFPLVFSDHYERLDYYCFEELHLFFMNVFDQSGKHLFSLRNFIYTPSRSQRRLNRRLAKQRENDRLDNDCFEENPDWNGADEYTFDDLPF